MPLKFALIQGLIELSLIVTNLFSDGPYLIKWPKLASSTNLTLLVMIELCASHALFVLCAGSRLMNHGLFRYYSTLLLILSEAVTQIKGDAADIFVMYEFLKFCIF